MLRGPDWVQTGQYETEYYTNYKKNTVAKLRGLFQDWNHHVEYTIFDLSRPKGMLPTTEYFKDDGISRHVQNHWYSVYNIINNYLGGWPLKEE